MMVSFCFGDKNKKIKFIYSFLWVEETFISVSNKTLLIIHVPCVSVSFPSPVHPPRCFLFTLILAWRTSVVVPSSGLPQGLTSSVTAEQHAAALPSKIMLRQRSTAIRSAGDWRGSKTSSPGGRHSTCWPPLAKISVDTRTITDIHTNGPWQLQMVACLQPSRRAALIAPTQCVQQSS